MAYLIGAITVLIIIVGCLEIEYNPALNKCPLPRTERCVIKWVPESTRENQK